LENTGTIEGDVL